MRANYKANVTAQFQVLSEDQIEEIYFSVLKVMQDTGFQVHSAEATGILAQAGAQASGDRVYIPSFVVEQALASAPARFTICSREGSAGKNIEISPNHVHFGPSGSNGYFLDPRTEERRTLSREDAAAVARVCDALPNIDYTGSLGTLTDVRPELASVYEFADLISNSGKPPMAWAYGVEDCREVHEIAVVVAGGVRELERQPNYFFLACPTSPLVLPGTIADQLIYCAQHGIPFVCGPCPMCGASAPSTLAGTLVIDMADSLLGLIIAQTVRPGTPFFIGGTVTSMDMRFGTMAYGAPELCVLGAAEAEMARYLGVPVWTTAGASDSKLVDQQATLEGAISVACAVLSGHDLVHNVGYIESTKTGSLQQLVMMDEVIGYMKHVLRGIEVTGETLAAEVIDRVGPGGDFLGTEHTLKHFKSEVWYPTIIDRRRRELWESEGCSSMAERVQEKLNRILDGHKPVPLAPDIRTAVEAVLATAEERATSASAER